MWVLLIRNSSSHSALCCFQTSLPLAALPLWWWFLYNWASATCRRGMTWPSGKQRHASRLITLPLCPSRQIADSWILFNLGAMPLDDAKAAWPLRAATLKQQAMITRQSGEQQASLKPALVDQQLGALMLSGYIVFVQDRVTRVVCLCAVDDKVTWPKTVSSLIKNSTFSYILDKGTSTKISKKFHPWICSRSKIFVNVNIDRLLGYVMSTPILASDQDALWDMWKWSIGSLVCQKIHIWRLYCQSCLWFYLKLFYHRWLLVLGCFSWSQFGRASSLQSSAPRPVFPAWLRRHLQIPVLAVR